MKSLMYSILGNAAGLGIPAGKAVIVTGTTIAKGGEKMVSASTSARDAGLSRAAKEKELEETKRATMEQERHNAAMERLEKARQKELEAHKAKTAPQEVPAGAAA